MSGEYAVALCIIYRLVAWTVRFDHQKGRMAIEIDNEAVDHLLSAEMDAQAAIA